MSYEDITIDLPIDVMDNVITGYIKSNFSDPTVAQMYDYIDHNVRDKEDIIMMAGRAVLNEALNEIVEAFLANYQIEPETPEGEKF